MDANFFFTIKKLRVRLCICFVFSYSFFLSDHAYAQCNPSPAVTDGGYAFGITRVKVGSIDHFSSLPNTDCSISGLQPGVYSSGQSTNLTQCSNYNLEVTYDDGAANCGWSIMFEAWIDYNTDGDFSDPGEDLGSVSLPSEGMGAINFTVSPSASLGAKTLRIVGDDQGSFPLDPCLAHLYGETEDYTVNIVAGGSGMIYLSSAVTQGNQSNVNAGTTNSEVIGIQIVAGCSGAAISATSFSFNTTGTNSLSDIVNAKVWYTGTSSTFATTTLLGTINPVTNPFTITGTQTLSIGTNYFWLTYDVNAGASCGNHIDAVCTSVTVGGSPYAPTPTTIAGSRMISGAGSMVYQWSQITQGNIADITTTGADKEVIGIQIGTLCSSSPINATSFSFNTTGTTSLSDIARKSVVHRNQ